jgi:WD40 repeat protein
VVRIWDLKREMGLGELARHSGPVLAIAAAGGTIVSASADLSLRAGDDAGGEWAELAGHTSVPWAIAITPDGRRAVSGSFDTTVRVWDLERRIGEHVLTGHAGRIVAVAVAADGRRAVSGAYDTTVRVWDLERGEELAVCSGHRDKVRAVAISPDNDHACSVADDGMVIVWDLDSGRSIAAFTGDGGPLTSVTWTGETIVAGSRGGTVEILELVAG